MGEAKVRNDRMKQHIDTVLRNRAQAIDSFVRAYLAVTLPDHEKEQALANPSQYIADKVEMVDRVDHATQEHVIYFRRRLPHRDEVRELLNDVCDMIKVFDPITEEQIAARNLLNARLAQYGFIV